MTSPSGWAIVPCVDRGAPGSRRSDFRVSRTTPRFGLRTRPCIGKYAPKGNWLLAHEAAFCLIQRLAWQNLLGHLAHFLVGSP